MVVSVEFEPEEWTPAGDWARMYRALGLNVVPAARPAVGQQWKRPIVDWVEFRNVMVPDAQFERWYGPNGQELRRKNMGVICGAGSRGVWVLDLDIHKHPEAMAWFRALLELHNNGIGFETWMQRTGGGGIQIFFRAPEGWTPPTFKTAIGVDVRGQGGFAMLPPSMHESGRVYDWDDGSEPWACELETAPGWLCEAVDALRLEHGGQASPGKEYVAPEGGKNAFGLDTDGRDHKLAGAVWGAVTDLYRASPIMAPVDEQEAEIERLWGNYERTTKTRLDDATSNADGLEREGRGITALRQKWSYAIGQWDTKVAEAAKLPRPSDPPAAETVVTGGGQASVPAPISMPWVRSSELQFPAPERRWVVEDWIVAGAVNSLYGDGGLGKSLLAQQLMCSVSIGAKWLGLETTKGTVLGVFCEDEVGELTRRHGAIKSSLGFPIGNPFSDAIIWPRVGGDNTLVRFDKQGQPQLSPFHAELVEAICDLNPSLVILDTLADVYGGNELDRVQVNYFCKTVLGGIIKLQESRGHLLTIQQLGHPSVSGGAAGGGRGYSGSTAWNNSVRSRAYLTRPDDEGPDARLLTRGKSNYAKSGDGTGIRLIYSDGVLMPEPGIDLNQISPALEMQLMSRIKAAWDAKEAYSIKETHARYWRHKLVSELAACGYNASMVEMAVSALMSAGLITARRTGERCGLWTAGRG